jgi:hypothetical protein
MGMAEAGDPDSGDEIDVDIAIDVGQRRTLAMIEREACEQCDPLPSGSDIALLSFENLPRFGAWYRANNAWQIIRGAKTV